MIIFIILLKIYKIENKYYKGELDFYLKDRVNAFIANKADTKIFGAKILEALEDYDFAMKVARNGKELMR